MPTTWPSATSIATAASTQWPRRANPTAMASPDQRTTSRAIPRTHPAVIAPCPAQAILAAQRCHGLSRRQFRRRVCTARRQRSSSPLPARRARGDISTATAPVTLTRCPGRTRNDRSMSSCTSALREVSSRT